MQTNASHTLSHTLSHSLTCLYLLQQQQQQQQQQQVLQCVDHKTSDSVAIKIIRNKKRFHQQGAIEVRILQQLNDNNNNNNNNSNNSSNSNRHYIIRLLDHFIFRNHICLVFPLLSLNLYEFLKANQFRGCSLSLIRRFSLQLLHCLSLLHEHNVIHCDLKPENILLCRANSSEIRVIDFGSSCCVSERVYSYIQSRYYRSPEVILGVKYSLPIDMWSFGCILAELATGYVRE